MVVEVEMVVQDIGLRLKHSTITHLQRLETAGNQVVVEIME